jgi:hypothetical protein
MNAGAQALMYPPTPADRAGVISKGWAPSRDAIQKALTDVYQGGGPSRPGSTGVTSFRGWLLLWKWCDLLSRNERDEAERFFRDHCRVVDGTVKIVAPGISVPPELARPSRAEIDSLLANDWRRKEALQALLEEDFANPADRSIAEGLKPEILAEWVNDPDITRLLFQNISPSDYTPAVLKNLQDIRLAAPDKYRQYKALAVALSLVYDQRYPQFWPHHQVPPKDVPLKQQAIANRFAWWVNASETKGALLDMRTLGPEQIKFIVDAPLDPSEFEWARKNVKYLRSDFAKTFSSISYDRNRLSQAMYDWPDGEYTLENIRQKGGICVDQAYFAMIAGKAKCLPTLFFTGQGTDGGHAWFGYMKSDDKWDLDCGRYENQNYSVGEALDPQTWRPISDHELKLLAQRFRDKLEFVASQDDILLAGVFEAQGDSAKAARAYESAIQACAMNPSGWDAKESFLLRTGASQDALRTFHKAALVQFANDRDRKARHQAALAEIVRKEGDEEEAGALEKSIVSQNKKQRSDLSIEMAARQLEDLVEKKRYDEAFAAYRKQVNSLGKTGGGNFFFAVVRPYVNALTDSGDKDRARDALKLARKAMSPDRESPLESALAALEKEVN